MNIVVAAAGMAIAVLLAGSLPWAVLGTANQRVGVLVPWAIVPMALYLWAYVQFLSGRWRSDTAVMRCANLRANQLSARMWGIALLTGLLGFGAIMALLAVSARLVAFPAGDAITTPVGMPVATMFTLLTMQSIVAGVTEESAFRGYMQSMISRRYNLAVAILAQGTLFGLLHFPNHPRDVLVMLPYYIAVSAMYGGLTWAADSIWPAIVLHAAGDTVVLTRWWLTGRPEWQMSDVVRPLVWESGIDSHFIVMSVAAVTLACATMAACGVVRSRRLSAQVQHSKG